MPCAFDIDTMRNAILTISSGVLTGGELTATTAAIYHDPRFTPERNSFMDFSHVTEWQTASSVFARLAADRRFSDGSRTAFFATTSEGCGLGRVYQGWNQCGLVEVFQCRVEALAWINFGLPVELHLV
jgi:hypothetical protein